jgi:hypothetical protein
MGKKDIDDALLKDSVDRLWIFCKEMSQKLDGAIFKKDVDPYTRLLITLTGAVITALVLGVLKLVIK